MEKIKLKEIEMKNFVLNIESSKKHIRERNSIIHKFFSIVQRDLGSQFIVSFNAKSKKMNNFLKSDFASSDRRVGVLSEEILTKIIEHLIQKNISDVCIYDSNQEFSFEIKLNEYNDIYINYNGSYEKIKSATQNILGCTLKDNVYFFEITMPYSYGTISFMNTEIGQFLKKNYLTLLITKDIQLNKIYNAKDHVFDLTTTRKEDRKKFLNEVPTNEKVYVIYESIKNNNRSIYQKSYYDYGKMVNTTYGFAIEITNKNELAKCLKKCQKNKIPMVKVILPISEKILTFDKEGYWTIDFSRKNDLSVNI